jgi:hypothetical protein
VSSLGLAEAVVTWITAVSFHSFCEPSAKVWSAVSVMVPS